MLPTKHEEAGDLVEPESVRMGRGRGARVIPAVERCVGAAAEAQARLRGRRRGEVGAEDVMPRGQRFVEAGGERQCRRRRLHDELWRLRAGVPTRRRSAERARQREEDKGIPV